MTRHHLLNGDKNEDLLVGMCKDQAMSSLPGGLESGKEGILCIGFILFQGLGEVFSFYQAQTVGHVKPVPVLMEQLEARTASGIVYYRMTICRP